MKRYVALAGLTMAMCLAGYGQESTGNRVVVPSRNTSQPRVVKTSTVNAAITVKTHSGTDVIVETEDGAPRGRRAEPAPPGLHRIDIPRGVNVTQENNEIDIHVGPEERNLVLTVPVDTSLQLKSVRGPIRVEGVHGEVDATCVGGPINLTNISGTIVADSANGAINAAMDRVDPSKPISFSSVNGSVEVTLPADLKANLKTRTINGSVWTDFDVKTSGGFSTRRGGTLSGTINGGGVDASFSTVNGKITIRKK